MPVPGHLGHHSHRNETRIDAAHAKKRHEIDEVDCRRADTTVVVFAGHFHRVARPSTLRVEWLVVAVTGAGTVCKTASELVPSGWQCGKLIGGAAQCN